MGSKIITEKSFFNEFVRVFAQIYANRVKSWHQQTNKISKWLFGLKKAPWWKLDNGYFWRTSYFPAEKKLSKIHALLKKVDGQLFLTQLNTFQKREQSIVTKYWSIQKGLIQCEKKSIFGCRHASLQVMTILSSSVNQRRRNMANRSHLYYMRLMIFPNLLQICHHCILHFIDDILILINRHVSILECNSRWWLVSCPTRCNLYLYI